VRIAVVAGPDPGHAFPAVSLCLALRRAGHAVAFVSGSQWADAAAREGLGFVAIGDLTARPEDADFGWVLWGRSRELAPGIAASLRTWGAAAAVVDTITVAGWFAADLAGVPRIELVPHGLQAPSRALPPPGTGLTPGRTPAGRARDALLRSLHARSRRAGERACREARTSLGLAPDGPPAATLVATLPGLEPGRPDWPDRTEVVGPMEWDPADCDLAPPDGDGPLVLLADSSASGRPQTLLSVAAQGLQGMRVACTRFNAAPDPLPFGFAAGPGRQAPLLDAASVVVCAGGHGMVAKALVRGLPLVVVPGPGDQRENACRVERLGAGVHLPAKRLTPATLRAAVDRVLHDSSYAAAAARVGANAAGLGPDFAAGRVAALLSG
jgi:UDP:flavonoid glycosyltransferase YjiC (YdhE family)